MRIFISHASQDREIVEKLADLLVLGASVSKADIFCTSIAGLGVPNGDQFVNVILDQLNLADLIIAVLSESYFESPFCIAEVGAAQVRKKIKKDVVFHALLIPPADYYYSALSDNCR
jgi:TIR domain